MSLFFKLIFAIRFYFLKPKKNSRQQLRCKRLNLNGKAVSAAIWIDKMAESLPKFSDGSTQHDIMWQWYSQYGLKGLNLYLDYSRFVINRQIKIKNQENKIGIFNYFFVKLKKLWK